MERLKKLIAVAAGRETPDLVVKGGRIANTFTAEIMEADIAISDGFIAGIGHYDGPRTFDARGRIVCPGFIDGHIHLESTMLSPPELARAVIPRGTTAIVADPHEIANVMGRRGIRFLLDASAGLPLDIYFTLPSCVPATELETSGFTLQASDLLAFKNEPRVVGLAEVMNYPAVIAGENFILEKIAAFADRAVDGHAPLLAGKELNTYVAAGIRSDHECTALGEAREKLRRGMHIMIREGTLAKNMKALLPLVTPRTVQHFSLVSDDLHPSDLLERGHLDHLLNLAIKAGTDPLSALMMVTKNTARYFGLQDRGAIAPGYRADMAIISSFDPVEVHAVIKNGRAVFDKGALTVEMPPSLPASYREADLTAMNMPSLKPDAFSLPVRGNRIRAIGLIPNELLTRNLTIEIPRGEGIFETDLARDLLKIAVVERHHKTGNIGLGVVRGFGFRRGAIASSVAHDSHNILCVGVSDTDMHAAVTAVADMKGGLVVTEGGKVTARLPLPIGGLMSNAPLAEVARGWEGVRQAAKSLGCTLEEPFMALSFLALPVIPELKITDRGLVDVSQFRHVSLSLNNGGGGASGQ
ncbi:MAG: adenine deaminase [Deltaproteobacteria bacterium]|nr:adenine deaminase [Deltaproteobacteria bacterium]